MPTRSSAGEQSSASASAAAMGPPSESAVASATPPSRDPWRANDDPSDNSVVGPPETIPDCEARLQAAGVTWRPAKIPVHVAPGSAYSCGAPQVVIYAQGPTGVHWNIAPVVTCGLAIALARFETIMQEEAQRVLKQNVVRVSQGGTYSCRKMALHSLVSEHSYANAIDLYQFVLEDRREISVERYYGRAEHALSRVETTFLRALARRLFEEGVFSNVLTPFYDVLHRNHIHVDLGRYRVDGTR